MSSFASESEYYSSDAGWSSEDEIPLAPSGEDDKNALSLEDVLSEVIIDLGDEVAYSSDAPRHLDLKFCLEAMPVLLRQALSLADVELITVGLHFDSNTFGAGRPPRCAVTCSTASVIPVASQHQGSLPPHAIMPPQPPQKPTSPKAAYQHAPDTTEEAQADSAEDSEDSDSSPPASKRRQVSTPVQFQLTRITERKIVADWPQIQAAKFSQAKKWIIELHKYLNSRLRQLGDVCVYCDEPQLIAGPKPVACEKPMCRYQVDELGFGASVVVIYQEPMVADMLISLAAKAAGNPNPKHRQRFFACPYPPSDFVCSSKRTANAANPDESMGIKWAELQQVLCDLPTVSQMADAKNLKKFLDKHEPRAYRLVRWVLSTCRVHVVQLKPTEEIPEMGGHQFKLFTNTFEREVAFQKLKQQHGSGWAFHGSKFMNWHSILRTSLQNFSNTQYMLNGAAHGSGVYVAVQAATSVTYCQDHRHTGFDTAGSSNASYKNSVFGTNPACLSLTEVANLPALANAGGIKVVKDHDAVVARYLFVYAEGTIIAGGASTDRMKIPKWDDTCVSI